MKFYNEMPDMECLQGDTLDVMEIIVSNLSDYTSPAMHVQIETAAGSTVAVRKSCTATNTGFAVTLTSEDTENLCGMYYIDFILTSGGLYYKKLRGMLIVHPHTVGSDAA